jgi:hypothetical protein
MKYRFLFVLLIALTSIQVSYSQELKCNISINSQQIQGSNKRVFNTLQTALYEFMNNRAWSNHVFSVEERIECNILITISDVSSDEYKATLQIQARRPVYNSSYNTVMLNYVDNSFTFSYVEYEPLDFTESTFRSNLTSVMAFYAYMILGFDYDSFSLMGGTEFYKKAETIVNNAQTASEKGWKAFDSKNNKNRYWLVKNMLDSKYEPFREFLYRYHIKGLDLMDQKTSDARAEIADDLVLLQKIYRDKPDPYLNPLQIIFDAKADEFVNIFSESFSEEKNRVYTILKEIDPSNVSKYEKLIKQSN